MIVVDASIAIKWLVFEERSAEARALITQDERLIAPDLVSLEVHGAVLRLYRANTLTEKQARELLDAWRGLLADGVLILQPHEDIFDRAVEIALRIRHTLTDCLYLALAEQSGARLVTADRKLYERGKTVCKRIAMFGEAA